VATLYLLVLILAAGVGAQWLASRLHLPALLLLLATGMTLGLLHVLDPAEAFGPELLPHFVSLAVALVLFEGGLSLHLREARHVGHTLWRLILAGLILGFALVTVLGITVGKLTPATAAVLGAILVVTGPTVIIPMLRSSRIAFRPAALLKWEGIVNDPFGALLAILALQASALLASDTSSGFAPMILWFLGKSLLSAAIGGVVGGLLARALHSGGIREDLKTSVILASVLTVFAIAESIGHESGLLAVTAMGVVLANSKTSSLEDIRHFKEQISTLLVAFLFIVLSAQLDPRSLEALLGPPLVLIALILFAVRPVVVLAATLGSKVPWNERILLGWVAPRGVVAAAVAGAFAPRLEENGVEDAYLLMPIVFGVILSTVVLHGLTLRPLARKLGLAAQTGNGVLLVGASTWAVSLAQALTRAGAFVALADTRYRKVTRARLAGLEVHFGDVLSEETALEFPLERISWLLAATADDSYNSLVNLNFARELGRERVLQVTPAPLPDGLRGVEFKSHMSGVTPWNDAGSYSSIAQRFWRGATFKVTQTSEQYPWNQVLTQNPTALFLFYVHQERLGVIGTDTQPPSGSQVVYLADSDESGTPMEAAAAEPQPSRAST